MARTDRPEAVTPAAPESRGGAGLAALTYAVATFALGWQALLGRFLLNPYSDQYIAGYAFRDFAASSLRAGQGFPQWNPYLFGGMPYVGAMHGDIFYPTFLLRMVLPTDVAMTWGFVLHLWLAGFVTYLFLRRSGLGFAGALIGGLAYLLSGPIASYASPGHDGKLFVSALFPLVLLLLHVGIRGRRQWAWGALALVIGLAVLSTHPQLLEYLLLGGAAYGVFLLFSVDASGAMLAGRQRLLLAAQGIGAAAVGALIGMVQFWPVREYVSWSPRAKGMLGGYEHAVSYSFPPEELINTVLPQFSGILRDYWGRNGIHLHSEYLGIVVLLLAAAAFGGKAQQSFRRFFGGFALVTLLWALGGYTPFFRIIYAVVPGTTYFRAPSTIIYLTAFAVSVLAALGAERILQGKAGRAWMLAGGAATIVLALVAVSGGLTNLAVSIVGSERFEMIQQNQGAVALGAVRMAAFAALAIGLALVAASKRVPATTAAWGFVLLVGADLWSVERLYWRFLPPAKQIYGSDATIEYLKRLPQPGRVLPLELGQAEAEHDPFLNGDALMSHGIRSVRGYHGNELGRFDKLLGKDDGYRQLANPNFWALTNTRFLLTNTTQEVFPGMKRVAGPVRNAAGSMVYLYRLPGDNPPAWVTPAIVKAGDDAVLSTVLDPRFNVKTVALFDSASSVTAVSLATLPAPLTDSVVVTRWDPGHITLMLSKPAPTASALVVSENYYPGWTATVDGKPATAARANLTLIGVPLPAGATQVELTFKSESFGTGSAMTLAGCLLGLAWLGAGAALDRRAIRGA